ncbi:MAG: zinc-dependent metalloprotease [Bifidobacteriaceae bacterium]|nr:zinc-dependent metalloprotease [Bifidobacteriaceae bacterium]
MDSNELHQWMIDSFGSLKGEALWNQFSRLPREIQDQLLSQDPSKLPKPQDMHDLLAAFVESGISSFARSDGSDEEPINRRLAATLAERKAGENSRGFLSAAQESQARSALSAANLWLDSATVFDPAPGESDVLTPATWTKATIGSWLTLATPVAKSATAALEAVFSERLGGLNGEITGLFAGPVPIPIPEGMKDPHRIMRLLGSTTFAIQLGQASGRLAHEVFGSFDQSMAMGANPAGALVPENIQAFANSLKLPVDEVMDFVALREAAHARLFASAPWLMPQIEVLINKYARSIGIDLDAVEEQLRGAVSMNPEEIGGAVNLAKVSMEESPEQLEAKRRLESMLALVEGWVECTTWRAGSAFLPHISQLREMIRRRRAAGGPAEHTFESLLGLELRPRAAREACDVWEKLTADGVESRDAHWTHPDLLPQIPEAQSDSSSAVSGNTANKSNTPRATHEGKSSAGSSNPAITDDFSGATANSPAPSDAVNWDAALDDLLAEEATKDNNENTNETGNTNNIDKGLNHDGSDADNNDNGSDVSDIGKNK